MTILGVASCLNHVQTRRCLGIACGVQGVCDSRTLSPVFTSTTRSMRVSQSTSTHESCWLLSMLRESRWQKGLTRWRMHVRQPDTKMIVWARKSRQYSSPTPSAFQRTSRPSTGAHTRATIHTIMSSGNNPCAHRGDLVDCGRSWHA